MADGGRPGKRQLKRIVKEQSALVKRDPNNLVARLKLAGALKDLGRSQEAVEHYQAVAKAYASDGKLVQAISVYKGILDIVPNHVETEEALTALTARRAEEIKRKSMPRLQQVEGKWVMPGEEDVSEEEGTDPGKAPPAPASPSPSVLRLPVVPPAQAPSPRPRRRSRSRISVPSLDPAGATPAGGPPGQPEDIVPPQPSLPSLRESPLADEAAGEYPSPPVGTPPPLPDATPAPEASATPPPGPPEPISEPVAPDPPGEPELLITAETPEDLPDDRALEEPTSPGPSGYEAKIRESMPRLDRAGLDPAVLDGQDSPARSTLVGVPLPEHPSLRPRDLMDPASHVRPTPSVPLPAIRRVAAQAEVDAADEASRSEPETGDGREDAQGADATLEGGAAAGSDRAATGAAQTRALRKSPPRVAPEGGTLSGPTDAPVRPEDALPPDATLDDVFGEDEDAAWGELAELSESVQAEPPERAEGRRSSVSQATMPLRPTSARLDADGEAATPGTEPRSPRRTLVMSPAPAPSPQAPAAPTPSPRPASASADTTTAPIALETIPLFRGLSEATRKLLRSRVVVRNETAGAVIVREGEPGNALFVVREGEVDVTKTQGEKQILLATLGPGAFFGEFAILSDRRRHATVTARTDAALYEISRKVISDLTKAEPSFGTTLRSFYRRRLLSTLLRSATFFAPLGKSEQEALLGKLRFRRVPKGTAIIERGEAGGGFYLVLAGQVRVATVTEQGEERVLARLEDGAYFGEMSLLRGGKAVASVVAEAPTELVHLPAKEFYRILSKYPQIWEEVNREAKRRELANHQILAGTDPRSLASDEGVVL